MYGNYNLAKRKYLPKEGDTPDNVGPSTYILDSYKTFNQNYCPFLCGTKRDDKRTQYSTDAFYDVKIPHKIKGGNSIQNRAKREVYAIVEGPGPAVYNPPCPKRQPCPTPRPPSRGKLYLCNVPRGMGSVAPSIPTKVDENGYYMDVCGRVMKYPPEEHDTTLGPAFYHVLHEPPYCCSKLYKGCAWSKRLAKRHTIITNSNPGPGQYDIPYTFGQFNARDEYIREMARLFGYVPRSLEAAELRTLKEDLPGPGYYDANASTLKYKKSLSIYPQPFITGTKRWKTDVSDTPPSTQYNIKSNFPKKRVSYVDAPFGFDSPRFVYKHEKRPGPGDYDVKQGTIEEATNKARNFYGSVDVPFNISGKRKLTFVGDDVPFMPSSADYLVEPLEQPKAAITSCNFKSVTGRFAQLAESDTADPATYNISETFNKNRNPSSHNAGKVPFQSTQPKGLDFGITDNPGPADYLGHTRFTPKSQSFNRDTRWKKNYEDYPGPGTYAIHPQFEHAVYRTYDTHNLVLKENILRKKLRVPPGKTWESWYKELKKKRALKCYKKDTEEPDYLALLFQDF